MSPDVGVTLRKVLVSSPTSPASTESGPFGLTVAKFPPHVLTFRALRLCCGQLAESGAGLPSLPGFFVNCRSAVLR